MDDTNSRIEQRRAKLAALKNKGINPFRHKFTPATCAAKRTVTCRDDCVKLPGVMAWNDGR